MTDTNPSKQHVEYRRKAVLFCPVCGHESGLPGDWEVTTLPSRDRYVCPGCGTAITGRASNSQLATAD